MPEGTALNVFTVLPSGLLTPVEVAHLSERARSKRPDAAKSDQRRAQACGFIQSLGSRIGFPQRTMATAQLVYHRFHLFYPPAEFKLQEVALASMALSAKLNDTPKKMRELVLASYALRYPDLIKVPTLVKSVVVANGASSSEAQKSSSGASMSSDPAQPPQQQQTSAQASAHAWRTGNVAEADVDAAAMDNEVQRLMTLERLLLEAVGFDFQLRTQAALGLTIKFGRKWGLSRNFCQAAWSITADTHRTYEPLCYPPSTLALASLYLAALLAEPCTLPGSAPTYAATLAPLEKARSSDVRICRARFELGAREWVEELCSTEEDVEQVIHALLDLYTSASAALPASMSSTHAPLSTGASNFTPISPATPASPAEPPSSDDGVRQGGSGSSRTRSLPSYAFAPPPLGVLNWLNDTSSSSSSSAQSIIKERTPHEFIQEATQLKIALRGREDARVRNDWALMAKRAEGDVSVEEEVELRRAERRRRVAAIASEVRELERGGVRGVGEEVRRDEERSKEKKVTLTRFLF